MPEFLSPALADLTRQLTYASVERVRKQMDNAEELYAQIDPDRNYPLEFIVFRVTRFRPDNPPATTLTGHTLRRDLLLMVERLSDTVNDRYDAYDPPPRDLPSLCRQLKVSDKTISRYRTEGLFARRLVWRGGRKRLGFLPASVERFLASRPQKIEKAARFSRIDEELAHEIITRARRIRSRVDASPFAVARHLARRTGRSTEAIRKLLLRHDRSDPRIAIFPEHTPKISSREQRVIYRAFRRGVGVSRLTKRFKRSRNVIYRAINLQRAAALRLLDIRYVVSPTFELPDAEQVILETPLGLDPGEAPEPGEVKPKFNPDAVSAYMARLQKQPPLDARTEGAMFARYNFLKYRADQLRASINRHHPRPSSLDLIETYLRRAASVKQELAQASLRLVVSVARRHMAGGRRGGQALADLIGEGNLVLVEAIETFDAGRGNRFSTYITWALMRRFAKVNTGSPATSRAMDEPAVAAEMPFEHEEEVTRSLSRLFEGLDERERFILTHHFGLSSEGKPGKPRTLLDVSKDLGITAERVRQIERRALLKLRKRAGKLDLPLPDLGAGPVSIDVSPR